MTILLMPTVAAHTGLITRFRVVPVRASVAIPIVPAIRRRRVPSRVGVSKPKRKGHVR